MLAGTRQRSRWACAALYRLCVTGLLLGLYGAPPCHADRPAPLTLSKFGILVPDTSNPYFSTLLRAAHARITQSFPQAKLLARATGYDEKSEATALSWLRQEGVQVLLVAAAGPRINVAEFKAMHAAGIKIIAVDVDAPVADVTIESDNRQAGFDACRYLAKSLAGRGRVVIVNGPPAVSSVVERVAGCKAALNEYASIQLVAEDQDGLASRWGGSRAMTAYLQRYAEIDGVFAINDPSALGAESAAAKAGRTRLKIASVDGSEEVRSALQRPGQLVATAAQDPSEIGRHAGEVTVQLLEDRYVGPRRVLLPTPLLVRSSATSAD
ncbi:substrate-binding domain-containing protein [Niveibacterium sp.]|uniref:substrate-binding domain-containing protein n=1 Tax=Niveibacterium sp. TaxID=2017444 RepID=UPI0035B14C7A